MIEIDALASAQATRAKRRLFSGGFRALFDRIDTRPIAAFSTRRVRTAWGGPCMRVRRSTDDAPALIGFLPDGSFDEAALLAHCGLGDGFVAEWFDQSGNGWHAAQATAANQPRIVSGGTIERMGTRAAPRFLGQATATFLDTPDFLNQGFTVVSASRASAGVASSFPAIYSRGTTGAHGVTFMNPNNTNLSVRFGGTTNEAVWAGFTAPANHVVSAYHSTALRRARGNSDVAVTETTALTADDALRRFRIGSSAGGTAAATFPGWVGELLVFQSDLGASEAVVHPDVLATWA